MVYQWVCEVGTTHKPSPLLCPQEMLLSNHTHFSLMQSQNRSQRSTSDWPPGQELNPPLHLAEYGLWKLITLNLNTSTYQLCSRGKISYHSLSFSFFICKMVQSSHHHYKVGIITIPILRMVRPRHRQGKWCAQDHKIKRESHNPKPGGLFSEHILVTSGLLCLLGWSNVLWQLMSTNCQTQMGYSIEDSWRDIFHWPRL